MHRAAATEHGASVALHLVIRVSVIGFRDMLTSVSLRFSPGYNERITLRNGLTAELRLIRPDDKELLLRGFHELSSASRYLRFLVPKTSLSTNELRYLTEVDHLTHIAIGAVSIPNASDDEARGLGIARLITIKDEPGYAEAAIAVRDEVQGQGLGFILFHRLVAAGRERGITHVRCEVLAANNTMKDLIASIAPHYTVDVGGGVVSIVFPLDPSAGAPGHRPDPASIAVRDWNPMQAFFTALARGTAKLRELLAATREPQ